MESGLIPTDQTQHCLTTGGRLQIPQFHHVEVTLMKCNSNEGGEHRREMERSLVQRRLFCSVGKVATVIWVKI